MNKTKRFRNQQILLAGILAILFSSCGQTVKTTATPASTSTYEWKPIPAYTQFTSSTDTNGFIHYSPTNKSKIPLEFDFPISWLFGEDISSSVPSITLRDPRFLTLPPPDPAEAFPHAVPNDFGSILIWNIPSKPGRTVESEVEDQKKSYRNTWWAAFLNEYTIAIDGFGAKVIEHQIQMPEIHTSLMFERRIYFFAENEIYAIFFEVAEKERGDEFEQGYEYFINSLNIVP